VNPADDVLPDPPDAPSVGSSPRVRPRTILLGALAAIVVAALLYAAAPWILPVRIREGPLVQMASADAVTLTWYTTRPAECAVHVDIGGQERVEPAQADGPRNRVRIAGLTPGTQYPYEIRVGKRKLTSGLAFLTNRAPDEKFTFIVFGDSGMGTRAQYLLATQMANAQPPADFLLHTGDMVYPAGARCDYEERFFAPYRLLIAHINLWPCLGNHDVQKDGSAPAYHDVFEPPDNGPPGLPPGDNYWFDYASCRIVVIDSNRNEATLRDQVAPWLRTVMAAPGPRWRFVALHHPPYTNGKHRPSVSAQRALVPVIEAVGVDVVFSGHDHNYQRTLPRREEQSVAPGEGVVYVVTGAGGAQLYEVREPPPDWIAAQDGQRFSFTQVTIDGDDLTLRQIALDGSLLDEYPMWKSVEVDELRPTTFAPAAVATSASAPAP
jgi:acid phosphatase type 7